MKKLTIPLALILLASLAVPAFAAWLTDPPATISQDGTTLILHKELSGYGNYGVTDTAADVLYSGETGTWTFSSTGLPPGTAFQFVISGVLDDHDYVPLIDYSMTVEVNGILVFSGSPPSLPFVHGLPYGKVFTNWTELPVDANGNWSITITNTSAISTSHWIAFDWIELHIALAEPGVNPPCWDITGQWNLEAYLGTSTYFHTFIVLNEDPVTGIFSGYGDHPSLTYSYNLVGTVDGCSVTYLRTDYPDSLYWAVLEGDISVDGLSMLGTWYDRNGNSGTWTATGVAQPVCTATWLPPITNLDFALQNGTTLPIKFRLCSPGDCSADLLVKITGPSLLAYFSPQYDALEDHYIVNFHTKDYPDLVDEGLYTVSVLRDGCCPLGSYDFDLNVKAGRGNSGK